MKKSKIIIFLLIVCLSTMLTFLYNRISFLSFIAASTDTPSALHYLSIKKILKLSSKDEDVRKNIIEALKRGDKYRQSVNIRLLGPIGGKGSIELLEELFHKYLNEPSYQGDIYCIVNSFGLIGDERMVPLLEKLLIDFDKNNFFLTKYSIVRSLFLITGKEYNYSGNKNSIEDSILTQKLKQARTVILNSKNRVRTYQEMVILYNLTFRSSGS